ncbi:serine/threonine-protein kinase [Spirulina major CS-329]|uniref:serine/threonine-protein kinase n=1 Tax=Spirulina TaxID=1154 RepID=UPI00232EF41D|nr:MULTISPECIES: serine/threonine-protein kinase [Spirulina]MDB9493647.1 serine/threonine-protein kinase [Spirulina subsalsa CS-330]MDB9504428.1 serine/threonine-protein kinase [Spirulina major CS-329]
MAWQSGQSLYGDRYTIRKKLGQGGFGITYLAEDGQGQQVVIKTLTDEIMNSLDDTGDHDKFLRDFEKEALSLALCRHPHIVQIDNFFTHQGFPCIVMEYVEGLDLGKRLRQQGALPETEAVRYMQQVGDGLRVIHQKGRLHRDIKPQNIMVRANTQEAVLIDFGIAREFLPDVTQTQTAILTPGFAPIEQYNEQARRGEFTDVYALAATLSTLITGANPPPSFTRVVKDCFQVPQNCSAAVRAAIEQGMAIPPEDRPKTVTAWLKLLPSPKVQPQQSPPQPQPSPLQVPARYQRLAELLKAGDWRGADEETYKQTLAVANCIEEGCLDIESIEKFPCEDLRAIDQLWVHYSKGRFGFSVQKRIYQALGGTREYDPKVWAAFGDAVGWRKGESWFAEDLTFNTKADKGHLPVKVVGALGFWSGGGYGEWEGISSLASRLVGCNI